MMKQFNFQLSQDRLDYACNLMKALAHPLRLKILEYIDEQGVTNVNRIYNTLKIEQSITSQHLKVLRLAGVVSAERDGKMVLYTINYPVLEKTDFAMQRFREAESQRQMNKI